jgi:uncharacterized protein
LKQFRDGEWDLVVSGGILEEYGEVLKRPKFGLDSEQITEILEEIAARSVQVIPSRRYKAIAADPDDNEFIDVSVEAAADFLVSGDHHLLDLKKFKSISIVTPAQFLAQA